MRNGGIQIRVSDVLFALQKRWKIIISLTFVGLVFGLMLSAMTYVESSLQSFSVAGSYVITTRNPDGSYINSASHAGNNDFHLAEDMADAVTYILRSDRVLNEIINREELLGVTADDIRGALTVNRYGSTQIMEMALEWHNSDEGLAIWSGIVEIAGALLPELLQMGSLEILNPPEARALGVGGVGTKIWMFLAVLGFAAGLGYAMMELLMHPTLNNVKDVETMFGLETIGTIPRDNAYFRRKTSMLVENEPGSSEIVQNYSAAAYILRNRLGTRDKHHCFYVTSATAQEGKSTVAANLAIQLSDMEHKTLLVDFDTRNPSLGTLFLENVDYAHSLNALYRGESNEADAITTLTGYLDLLPMVLEHNPISMDGMVVELIQRLTEKYEYVILDASPVGMVSDTLSLNQVANTVLYVVGYDKATIPEIQSSLEKLDKSGIRVLGCIINGVMTNRGLMQGGGDSRKRRGGKGRKPAGAQKPAQRFEGEAGASGPAPVDGLVKVPRGASARSGAEKPSGGGAKKRRGLFGRRRAGDDAAAAPEPEARERVSMPAPPKNIFEDLMAEDAREDALSDQDTAQALYRMGIEGTWDSGAPSEDAGENAGDGGEA